MATHDLAQLRTEVANIDQQILALIARRLETTRAIGAIKQQQGLPIRDFRVEVEVLKRARLSARNLGLDERVAEDIAEKLMTAAVQTQAELPPANPASPCKKLHIVGGHGRMGQWLAQFFESLGHRVTISDPRSAPVSMNYQSLALAAEVAEVIVLATNLSATPKVLEDLLAQIPSSRKPLIFDIASLKTKLVSPLRQAAKAGFRVTSLHPMFAPGPTLLHGRAILVCDAGNHRATEDAKALFAPTALGLYDIALEEHDKVMAVVLGLSHLTNLVFGRAVAKAGLPFDLLGKIASTTFAKQIKTAAEVAAENPALYHEIQFFNSATQAMQQDLQASLQDFIDAARQPSGQRFAELMAETTAYLDATSPSV